MTDARPTRHTVAGETYLRLRRAARAQGRLTDEYLRLYVLECFLVRLSDSAYADQLVIKGGVLLAAYAVRRPTADIDVAARQVPGQVDEIREIICSIASRPDFDDGVVFDTASAVAEQIRDEDQYSGVRVSMAARLATAAIRFHVDVNIGDPIWPEPGYVQLPRLLGGEIVVRGYPLAMVLAEKIVTAHERGVVNTRWRDFADVYLLSGAHPINADVMAETMRKVAAHRHIELRPLREILSGYAESAQARWAAWRRKQMLCDVLPEEFGEVLVAVYDFADAMLEPAPDGLVWRSEVRRWISGPTDR